MIKNTTNLNRYLELIAPKGSQFIKSDDADKLSYLSGIANIKCKKMNEHIEFALSQFPHIPSKPFIALAYEEYGDHRIDKPNTSECASHKYTTSYQLYGTGFIGLGRGSSGGLIGNITKLSDFLSKSDDEQAKDIAEEEAEAKKRAV
ncbi:MAG: hypothetical protein RLZZ210_867 [Pseudomonadota bacterium]